MTKRKDIEARHAKRLADGWRWDGWVIRVDLRKDARPKAAWWLCAALDELPADDSWCESPTGRVWFLAFTTLGFDEPWNVDPNEIDRIRETLKDEVHCDRCGRGGDVASWSISRVYRRKAVS